MVRNTAREIAVHLAYELSFTDKTAEELVAERLSRDGFAELAGEDELYSEYPNKKQLEYIRSLTALMYEKRDEIDAYIERYAHGWKRERISKTALAVLRCAICEIMYMDDVPASAAINEAVELDKGYDEPETVAFVNGILGGFMRGEFPAQAEAALTGADEQPAPEAGE